MNEKKAKIVSIQALRALAFLGIFLEHAGASTLKWPAFGVSIFFVLSGYLMTLQYYEKDIDCSIKSNVMFSWKKIKKLYPLHIITMCFAIVLSLVTIINKGITLKSILYLIGCTGLNITLLQTWVPNSTVNVSLNGVAWYLSVSVFLYFMFPYIKRWLKGKDNNKLLGICIGILIFEIIACIPLIILLGNDSPVYIWFMYCFPVFRLGDFFLGCCLGKRAVETPKSKDKSCLRFSIYEVIATIITVAVFWWMKQEVSNPLLLATHNWTTLFIPLAIIWIELFVNKSGIITKILTNRVTIFIGNISAYTFLIHYIVTSYFSAAISFLNVNLSFGMNVIIILIEFLLTIGITLLYMKLTHKRIELKYQ